MTATDTYPLDRARTERPSHARSKSVLFCVECGHENPVDGDWVLDREDGHETRYCPNCDSVVTDR
jgi:hypothetical protein